MGAKVSCAKIMSDNVCYYVTVGEGFLGKILIQGLQENKTWDCVSNRAIICPTNKTVDTINRNLTTKILGEAWEQGRLSRQK